MDFVASVVADEESFVVVEPGEGAFDDPAVAAKPRAVIGAAAGDFGRDATAAELAAMALVVVTAVGGHPVRSSAWPADLAAHGRHTLDQRHELGYVVAVTARERPGERDPCRVDEEMVLRPVSGSINRARARFGAPFFACT